MKQVARMDALLIQRLNVEKSVEVSARIYLVAHPVRIKTMILLHNGPKNSDELRHALGISYPNTIKHLHKLQVAGLIKKVVSQQEIKYELAGEMAHEMSKCLSQLVRAPLQGLH